MIRSMTTWKNHNETLNSWQEGRKNAKTVDEKKKFNVWDSFMLDVLPTIKKAIKGEWSWPRNPRCKYITVRIDMRDGHCVIMDRDGERINPEDLKFQRGPGKLEELKL